jgi:hypothetical protein
LPPAYYFDTAVQMSQKGQKETNGTAAINARLRRGIA